MLSYSPQTKPHQAMLFSSSCAAAGLILFFLSAYIGHKFLLLPIIAMILILLGVWFLYRFALISYRYEIREGVLYMHRRIFRCERTVYTLSLGMAFAVIGTEDTAARKRTGVPYRCHNFLTVWPTEHAVILYYRDAQKLCAVYLEDNPAFLTAASKYFGAFED